MGSQVPSGFTGIRLSSPKSLCQRRRCLAFLGLGWWGGGRFTKFWKSTSSLYWLAQQVDATLQDLLLDLTATCRATWCYATRSSLAKDLGHQGKRRPFQPIPLGLDVQLAVALWFKLPRIGGQCHKWRNTWKKLFERHRPQRKEKWVGMTILFMLTENCWRPNCSNVPSVTRAR